jgi:hypothetical protein
MTFGGVVGDEIEDDLDLACMRAGNKAIELLERSE